MASTIPLHGIRGVRISHPPHSLRTHETLCKMNPNRKESNFVKFNLSEKKYKNQFDKAKKLGLPKPEFSEDSLKRISDATKKRNKQLYYIHL